MDLELNDRHVLIAGGSKGIGLACAIGFVREGARVTLLSRSADNLATAHDRIHAACPQLAKGTVGIVAADLRDPAAALHALETAEAASGPIDILINSAGAARRTPPDELSPQAWHDAMQAKYFTYIHLMDPVVKRMAARGKGAIVNVIGAGGKVAMPIHLPGGAANAALMLASAGLAAAYAARGLRVNAVNPGLTATERLMEGLAADASMNGIGTEEALRRATARLPMGRIAEPEEIADAVLFLASPRASYINGAILAMDGAATPMI
jgi:NAD(P)-dependent dehydrogenase (short-subunit alcohol dehydrogenase family)